MEVWPPPPKSSHPEPNLESIQAEKKKRIGYIALACSAIAILLRVVLFITRSSLLGELSLLMVGIGLVLGIVSRSTLAGRLAFLGPASFLLLLVYYMLCWYRVLPYY